MSSFVCTLSTVQNTNKNLFDCQRGFSFKVRAELLSMECKVEIDSTYICRNCQRKRNESALHEVNIALCCFEDQSRTWLEDLQIHPLL